MTQDQLLKYAEHGVVNRLHEIRAELAELATAFPSLVESFRGPNGTVVYDARKKAKIAVKPKYAKATECITPRRRHGKRRRHAR